MVKKFLSFREIENEKVITIKEFIKRISLKFLNNFSNIIKIFLILREKFDTLILENM